ncbi:37S ribosomal protein [Mycena indigotica]|uniref:37S ribosomal protein n=1 Tax=Mycena indigotica TaxID=2126181 RepID=A0A8H6WEZ7_9AGAR|nr:37S ribosomal protein [Mycena indigotica]KAF7316229.1 37S ribosomal protein [Mycena indigotica]
MHRIARVVRRRQIALVARRIPEPSRIRRFSSQTPTPESLYAEYIEKVKLRGAPPPISFEQFRESLTLAEEDVHDLTGNAKYINSSDEFMDQYGPMLKALRELETSDPDAYQKTLDTLSEELEEQMAERTDPLFQERLDALEVEKTAAREVGRQVAQLILSTKDEHALRLVEDKLATYNGPLSVLNVAVEWFLKNPTEIEKEDPSVSGEAEVDAVPAHDNNAYYLQDTPYDELVRHMRHRDVHYAIQRQMHPTDRAELFRLLTTLVTPVFNEDMNTMNAIADIFNKYEDAKLVYRTQPRLPRVRRLDVFKRLLPRSDDETPETQAALAKQIADIAGEKKREAEIIEAERRAQQQPWPDLMTREPLLDSREVLELRPTKDNPYHNRVVIRNHHSIFAEALEADGFDFTNPNNKYTQTEDPEEVNSAKDIEMTLPISISNPRLIIIPIYSYFATQQTPKGRMNRFVQWTIVGDGHGIVGLGMGKHDKPERAHTKSLVDAIRNMDWVERFEDRTIWTDVRTKLGATQVILRPRPVGFGLRCNPFIHRLLTAAGIKDISAKVWGSRNRLGVLKATLRLLHSGHAPQNMGDGLGGPGRKMFKGTGLRNKTQIERERGRKMADLRV